MNRVVGHFLIGPLGRPATLLLLLALAAASADAGARVEGRVVNGTTGRPAAHQKVLLLRPSGGMQEVTATSTDSSGNFVLEGSELEPSSFYLLETEFHGVKYPAPVRFDSRGSAAIDLTLYDSTASDAAIRIQTHRVLVRAEGDKARVREEYAILNASDPPRTYVNSNETFRFRVTPEAKDVGVAVLGLLNMTLPQTPEPGKAAGEFSIRYPLKPGVTTTSVAYQVDYASRAVTLIDQVSYSIDQTEVYASPASLSISSPLLKPVGVDSANNIQKLEAGSLARQAALEFRLAGEPAASTQAEKAQSGTEVKIVPNSMTQLATPLLACFLLILIWALGVRVAKEWPRLRLQHSRSPADQRLDSKADGLFNSIADLDDLFAAGKIAENRYWKERLELKARLAALLKKAPSSLLETYVTRHSGS